MSRRQPPPRCSTGLQGQRSAQLASTRPTSGDRQRLWNTAALIDESERWSRVYRGRRELIDHVFVSHALIGTVEHATTGGVEIDSIGDQPGNRRNAPASDHRPVLVDLAL